MTIRVAMWSGPRNISTALMRSWENRLDTSVVDEPFYAYYLNRCQVSHPGFDEIVNSQSIHYKDVAEAMSEGRCNTSLQYQKHMTHHLFKDDDLAWTAKLKHAFLIRDPAEIVSSYTAVRGSCELHDIGIEQQLFLYKKISKITGQDIPIIDSNDVLRAPKALMRQLCHKLGVPFSGNMLKWAPGKRASDGIWAPYWYESVEASTGFKALRKPALALDMEQHAVVAEATPYFHELYAQRLIPSSEAV